MKTNLKLIARLAACSVAGLLAASPAFAQPTNNPNTFDTASSVTSFVRWWGVQPLLMTWDATRDAGNDPSSGSVRYEIPFTGAAGDQMMSHFTLANRWGWDAGTEIDATTYTNLAFDIKVDPSSPVTPAGNYGQLEVGYTFNPGWGWTIVRNYAIPLSATNWTRVNCPINPASTGLDRVVGFFVKMWSNGAHTNTLIFNLDNYGIYKPEVPVVIPPPTVALEPAPPGVAFVAASGGQWDRQTLRTVGSNYSWIGRSGPVSYSVDIAKHVPPSGAGMQFQAYFVPGVANPGRGDSDWYETHVLMWRIYQNANGTGWSEINFKTNAPDSNGRMYDAFANGGGAMGGVEAPSGAGLWTLTFNQDTEVTITAPNGAMHSASIPPEVIALFNADPRMQVSFGIVPGDLARVGNKVTVNRIQISNTAEPNLNTDFRPAPWDTNVWTVVASSPTFGVQHVPVTSPFWFSWSLPAGGFVPQFSDRAAGGAWSSPTLAGYNIGGKYNVLLKQSDLPAGNTAFARMLKRVGTKLLVLLPGETAAPGTPTGKTGTPTVQQGGVSFDVVVNLVDNDWYPVTAPNDLVKITAVSSPPDGFSELPPDSILLGGTRTFPVALWQAGPWTITATDVTNPAITAGSATVMVQW